MNIRGLHHVLMGEEGGDAGAAAGAGGAGAGGAAAGGDGGAGAGATGGAANAGAGDGGAAAGSALAAGAGGEAPGGAGGDGSAAAASPWGPIPEKFRVNGADGQPDLSASWAKVEEHRAHLERRLGAGDIPPKADTDYKTTVPEALKDAVKVEDLEKSERFLDFRKEMHAAGLSQKQFDQVVAKMIDYGMKQREGDAALSQQECIAELSKTWADEGERTKNLQAAYRAAQAYGDVDRILAKHGNDPDVIRLLARVGKELGEDTPAGAGAAGASSDLEVEALQKSPAYWNANDPQHAQVKAKVAAHYATKFGSAPKASGSMAIHTTL